MIKPYRERHRVKKGAVNRQGPRLFIRNCTEPIVEPTEMSCSDRRDHLKVPMPKTALQLAASEKLIEFEYTNTPRLHLDRSFIKKRTISIE
jgi:hypothetical protein